MKINNIDITFDYSTVKGSTELHEKFKKDFIKVCAKVCPDVMVIPYDVGFYRAYSQPDIIVRCGQKGVLDTVIITPKATLWFDMKTGKNTLQENQKNFIKRLKEIKGEIRGFKINSIKQGLDLIQDFNA